MAAAPSRTSNVTELPAKTRSKPVRLPPHRSPNVRAAGLSGGATILEAIHERATLLMLGLQGFGWELDDEWGRYDEASLRLRIAPLAEVAMALEADLASWREVERRRDEQVSEARRELAGR